jgi:hypothetical protein
MRRRESSSSAFVVQMRVAPETLQYMGYAASIERSVSRYK